MPTRSFREILRKGRRDLHDQLKVPALYIAHDGATPVSVDVRLRTKFVETGDLGMKHKGYATMAEAVPHLLFFRDQLAGARNGAIFSVAEGEAYRVERTDPPNDESRVAYVTIMSAEEATGLPVPVVL